MNEDILKFDIEKIINSETIIIGNLPYNISSQILIKFLKFKNWPPKNFKYYFYVSKKEVGKKLLVTLVLRIMAGFLLYQNCD